ncbi:MAG TPA: Sec-independent protein translocase protein TatB [Novosphingobium sp.]|nr:Sec-independent protein translocase protein TatB [Novosphingobium sp.]HNN56559.1 Sec-independent protein translocase protein TatB [Novosphingobium sp.]
MFDIGWDEMLFTLIVAIVVIGPKDLPRALRTAGRWIGKVRRVSGHFRSGIETMIREAELADMEKQWKEQNAAIMAAHPAPSGAEAALPDPGMTYAEPLPPDTPPAAQPEPETPSDPAKEG